MNDFHEQDTVPSMEDVKEQRRQKLVEALELDELRKTLPYSKVSRAASAVCGTSMAFVSLMENNWQCVIGQAGMSEILQQLDDNSIEREVSFCTYTLAKGRVLVVEDLSNDDRFDQHPMVTGEPNLRFYAGVPLMVDDVPVGTLCAVDTQPQVLGPRERGELFGLVHQLELSLDTRHTCGSGSAEQQTVDRLADMLASSVYARHSDSSEERYQALTDLENDVEFVHRQLRKGTPGLANSQEESNEVEQIDQSSAGGSLGAADTAEEID
jgi:GAF domain-containing protein